MRINISGIVQCVVKANSPGYLPGLLCSVVQTCSREVPCPSLLVWSHLSRPKQSWYLLVCGAEV